MKPNGRGAEAATDVAAGSAHHEATNPRGDVRLLPPAPPGRRTGAASEASGGIPTDEPWRASVAMTLLIAGSITAATATAVVLVSHSQGVRGLVIGAIGVAGTLVTGLCAVAARRHVTLQAWIGTGTLIFAGLTGFVGVGFLAGPAVLTTCGVVAAALLLGRRVMFGFIAFVALSLGVIGALSVSGVLEAPALLDTAFDSPRVWLRTSAVMVAVLVLIGIVVSRAVGWLERAVAKAREEMRLRVAAEQRQLEAERAAHEARSVELVGHLAAAVAHDFNNALAVIQMSAHLLRDAPPDEVAESATAILEATRDASALTRQLLVLGRRDTRQPKVLSLGGLVEDYRTTVARVLPSDVELTIERSGDPWVEADEVQLHQVLLNLAVNARDALRPRARVVIRTGVVDVSEVRRTAGGRELAPGRYATLEVEDNGAGMSEEVQRRAFEPFFTTKGKAGTGLGLASVLAIADMSGGHVTLTSEPERGTRVLLHFPQKTAAAPQPHEPTPHAGARLAGARILLVEDEPLVLRLEVRSLTACGAIVGTARDGDEAMRAIEDHMARFDALCIDAVMPGRPVSEVIAAFEQRFPGRPVLVCSGHVEETLLRRGIESGRYTFLAKPFRPDVLIDAIAGRLQATT